MRNNNWILTEKLHSTKCCVCALVFFYLFDIILDDQSKGMDIVCVNSNARTVVNGSVFYVHLIGKSISTNPVTLKSVWPMIDKMKIFYFKILTEFRILLQYAMNSYAISQKVFLCSLNWNDKNNEHFVLKCSWVVWLFQW